MLFGQRAGWSSIYIERVRRNREHLNCSDACKMIKDMNGISHKLTLSLSRNTVWWTLPCHLVYTKTPRLRKRWIMALSEDHSTIIKSELNWTYVHCVRPRPPSPHPMHHIVAVDETIWCVGILINQNLHKSAAGGVLKLAVWWSNICNGERVHMCISQLKVEGWVAGSRVLTPYVSSRNLSIQL